MKSKKKLVISILVCLIILVPILGSFAYLLMPISGGDRTFDVRISKDDTKSEVISKLDKLGAVKIPFIASTYFNIKASDELVPGEYKFKTTSSVKSMLDDIANGKIAKKDTITVTIPEGFTAKQIADKLLSSGIIKSAEEFMKEINQGDYSNYKFLSNIPKDRQVRLEGYLYPDTYEFKKDSSNKEIISKMLDNFKTHAYKEIEEGAKRLSISTDDIVKMASVIEKEARSDEERPIISGVFYNRIKVNMKLQSCATVLYALGEHKDKLYLKDLEVNSPYNTYKNPGLPIGPISNPGLKSIGAAVNPASHDYIYFVLQNNGKHFFTKDYNEFLKAKKASNNVQ